jgi:O-antigen ligase
MNLPMAVYYRDQIDFRPSRTPIGGRGLFVSPDWSPSGASSRGLIHPLVRWGFYGYTFSLPFEYPEREIPVEVHTLTGAVFLLLTLLQPRICFRSAPRALYWLGAFLCLYLVRVCFAEHLDDALRQFFNLLQVFFLFWAAYNLLQDRQIAKTVFLSFVAACTLLVIMGRLGLTEAAQMTMTTDIGRMTMFGQDANGLASRLALTVVILAGSAFEGHKLRPRYALLILPFLALHFATIEYTGSRGAYLALLIGLAVFGLGGSGFRSRARVLILTLLVVGLWLGVSYRAGNMWGRLERTLQGGDMSGREMIYPAAIEMVLEQPLLGFGPADNLYELEDRVNDNRPYRDTHNLVLELFTSCGIMGAIPYLACIALCVRAGWKARTGAAGMIPLAMSVTLLAMSMSINMVASKTLWLVLAYAAAVGSSQE